MAHLQAQVLCGPSCPFTPQRTEIWWSLVFCVFRSGNLGFYMESGFCMQMVKSVNAAAALTLSLLALGLWFLPEVFT